MKILGLSEGHNCSAAIMIDGQIIAASTEERFTRRKNESGYPKQAIDFCLSFAEVSPDELDLVACSTIQNDLWWSGVRNEAMLTVADHVHEQYDFYKPLLIDKEPVEQVVTRYLDALVARFGIGTTHYDFEPFRGRWTELLKPEVLRRIRVEAITRHLGVSESKIAFFDHHDCHAGLAYFSSPYRDDNTLIATMDSSGDRGINATLRLAKPDGITKIFETNNFQFARVYKYITLLLGMRPQDHEYKVMGLAPYGSDKEIAKSYPIFDEIQRVNGLNFEWVKRPKDLYFHFREAFEGHRFDGIAGALQKKLETMVCEWMGNALRETGASTVVFGGGVAMNIKLSMALSKLPGVEKFSVGPSPADESNSLGVCYTALYEHCQKNGVPYREAIPPLSDAHLGPVFDWQGFLKLIKTKSDQYKVLDGVTDSDIAKKLAEGNVVARCIGRMEFGARALGNRSLLANPSRVGSVKEINRQIKHRDFWMPFATSLLEEYANEYLRNPQNLRSDYMTLGFDTLPRAHTELLAAIHPEDLTARPQIVRRAQNEGYHHLLSEFQKQTGIGGVLNTSLNLHGYPIVNTPEDLLFVLDNSDLQHVYIEGHLVSKK